jgi:hypothetical protein
LRLRREQTRAAEVRKSGQCRVRRPADEIHFAPAQRFVGRAHREKQLHLHLKARALKETEIGRSDHREIGIGNQVRYDKSHIKLTE